MNPFRSWLGALNFLVLQWFGVRLARVVETQAVWRRSFAKGELAEVPIELITPALDRAELTGLVVPVAGGDVRLREITVGWRVLRWIVPLTGWWSDFLYIARRSR